MTLGSLFSIKNDGVVSKIRHLIFGLALAAFIIILVIAWHLFLQSENDELRNGFYNRSLQYVVQMRGQFLLLKGHLNQADSVMVSAGHKAEISPNGLNIRKALFIARDQAKGLQALRATYGIESLRFQSEDLDRLTTPVFNLLEPGTEGPLNKIRIDAIILKLDQIERQLAIDEDRLIREYNHRQKVHWPVVLTIVCLVSLVSAWHTRLILKGVRRLIRIQRQAKEQLIQEKELLATTLSSIGDAVITTDEHGAVTSLNRVAEQLTGWSRDEALGQAVHKVFPIVDARSRKKIVNPVEQVLRDGKVVYLSNHTTLQSRSGSEFQISDSAAPIRVEEGAGIQGVVLVFSDVTEQYRLRGEAEKERRNLAALMDFSPNLIQVRDLDGCYQFINRKFEKEFDCRREQVIGRKPQSLFNPDQYRQLTADDSFVIKSKAASENREGNLGLNDNRSFITMTFPLLDANEQVYAVCSVSTDITARKEQEKKILYQAHYDVLTDLPNRFLSLDRLTQLINEAARHEFQVAVMFIDLDDFKKVNDTLGHETGDKLLVKAGQRLKQAVRMGDTVGRLGGDEFIVLLGAMQSSSDATSVAENLLNQFRRPFVIDEREMLLTTSLGLAIYPQDGDSASSLLRCADAAMYNAKEEGRNTYAFFTESMNREVSRRLELEEQLHGAIERREFHVVYQPQIDLKNGSITGVEALLRWENSALGSISPDEFIPITEQTGQIVELGKFVLEQALKNYTAWSEHIGEKFKIAVNVSPRQFRDPNLVDQVSLALKKNGLSGSCLELEITEGVLLTGLAEIHETLTLLRKLGITIALDDFGTGYSSLSYLRTYPFDLLKIDRSFINDITADPSDLKLVNAIIAMARAISINVVAEGVETGEQLDKLREMNCDTAQGYFISRPLSESELLSYIRNSISS